MDRATENLPLPFDTSLSEEERRRRLKELAAQMFDPDGFDWAALAYVEHASDDLDNH